jgi:hypothetical protein
VGNQRRISSRFVFDRFFLDTGFVISKFEKVLLHQPLKIDKRRPGIDPVLRRNRRQPATRKFRLVYFMLNYWKAICRLRNIPHQFRLGILLIRQLHPFHVNCNFVYDKVGEFVESIKALLFGSFSVGISPGRNRHVKSEGKYGGAYSANARGSGFA